MNCLICQKKMFVSEIDENNTYIHCGEHCSLKIDNKTNQIIIYVIYINNYKLQGFKELNFTKLFKVNPKYFTVKTNWIPIDWNISFVNNLFNRLLKLKAFC